MHGWRGAAVWVLLTVSGALRWVGLASLGDVLRHVEQRVAARTNG